jgi:hypothetical protein
MAFSTSPLEKRGFQMAPIFNGLQPSKMPAHPCAVRSLQKNRVFQQAASNSKPGRDSRTLHKTLNYPVNGPKNVMLFTFEPLLCLYTATEELLLRSGSMDAKARQHPE